MPKKKSNIPANETPEQRFIRIALLKVNSIIAGYRALSRLTGTKAKSSAEQRNAINTALKDAHADAMLSLEGKKASTGGFKF